MSFEGKFAIVTGGATGIGAAVTRALAGRGATVFMLGRRQGELLELQAELERKKQRVFACRADITSPGSLDDCVAAIEKDTGRIDYVVHNAGAYLKSPLEEMEEADWDRLFDTNVKGIFLLTRRLLPLMRDAGGSIVTIGSTLAWQTAPGATAYAASKAAVVALTRSMAREFSAMKIRVNCICPGIVDTPIHDPYLGDLRDRPKFVKRVSEMIPLGRIGSPGDIAAATLFLLGEEAAWITGDVMTVDGGMSLL